jgi:diketogulonate reductase-like aldo/keto reductase
MGRRLLLTLLPATVAALFLCGSAAARPLGKTVTLRGGVVMPSVGLGSSGSCHPDPDGTERTSCTNYAAATAALGLGYRSFHDALSYENQAGLGAAIKDAVAAGALRREDIFLMSMVPKYLMGYNHTKASVAASLVQLQVEYLDLVMIHHRAADLGDWPRNISKMQAFPDGWAGPGNPTSSGAFSLWTAPSCALADPTWQTCQDETWKALVELRNEGIIKAIGVSNWMLPNLQRMKILGQELPAVNQIEQHIGWHDSEMVGWCAANGIVVQAATPLSRGKVFDDPIVLAVAAKHNKTASQIALRFLLDIGVSPIPSSSHAEYQAENLDVFGFHLDADDIARLGRLSILCRGPAKDGLQKCWGDPATMMCGGGANGHMFHCP